MEATHKSVWSWAAVPRVVWLTAAGLGIAVASAGAAMWLQPAAKPAALPAEAIVAPPAPVAVTPPPALVAAESQTPPAPPAKPQVAKPADAMCTHCGVIESVQAVKKKGQGTGLGAVAGGVVGGALGNHVGAGNGRKAMTVLGAVGGGFAGHEIEKRARSETVYAVRIRMDDGTLRTLTRAQAPAIGARVTVNGSTLRMAQTATRGAGG